MQKFQNSRAFSFTRQKLSNIPLSKVNNLNIRNIPNEIENQQNVMVLHKQHLTVRGAIQRLWILESSNIFSRYSLGPFNLKVGKLIWVCFSCEHRELTLKSRCMMYYHLKESDIGIMSSRKLLVNTTREKVLLALNTKGIYSSSLKREKVL